MTTALWNLPDTALPYVYGLLGTTAITVSVSMLMAPADSAYRPVKWIDSLENTLNPTIWNSNDDVTNEIRSRSVLDDIQEDGTLYGHITIENGFSLDNVYMTEKDAPSLTITQTNAIAPSLGATSSIQDEETYVATRTDIQTEPTEGFTRPTMVHPGNHSPETKYSNSLIRLILGLVLAGIVVHMLVLQDRKLLQAHQEVTASQYQLSVTFAPIETFQRDPHISQEHLEQKPKASLPPECDVAEILFGNSEDGHVNSPQKVTTERTVHDLPEYDDTLDFVASIQKENAAWVQKAQEDINLGVQMAREKEEDAMRKLDAALDRNQMIKITVPSRKFARSRGRIRNGVRRRCA